MRCTGETAPCIWPEVCLRMEKWMDGCTDGLFAIPLTWTKPKGKSTSVWPPEPWWKAILQSSIIAGKEQLYLSVL